jgi:hypothetical protein
VLKNFMFKLFFNNELDAMLDSLPHVASNVQVASSSTVSLVQVAILKVGEMERNLLSLLKRNHQDLMRRFMCFKICEHAIFHGLKALLVKMLWLHKFGVKFVAILKESQSC